LPGGLVNKPKDKIAFIRFTRLRSQNDDAFVAAVSLTGDKGALSPGVVVLFMSFRN
jgi:hypothetical protein